MVPAGKYYINAKAPGYNTLQSEIITASQTSILNYTLLFTSKPKIEFTLPVFGKVVLTVPSFSPPETFSVQKDTTVKQETVNKSEAFKPRIPAPDFSLPAVTLSEAEGVKIGLPNLENKKVNLENFKGKTLLLSFIAPWSPLSLEQSLFLSDVSSSLSESQAMLVVSLQESIASTQTFMRKGNYKFPIVADEDGKTAAEYKITILPYHVIIDANGKIYETFTGALTKEELIKKLSAVSTTLRADTE